jgi:hypothetical protein
MDGRSTELISPTSSLGPKFFYCCESQTDKLLRTNLLTGEQSSYRVPGYQSKSLCTWSEVPGGSLLVTGGYPAVREVVKIDTLRESAVLSLPPMHTARQNHAAVYHSQYLYVLGGFKNSQLGECERYVCAESRWEVLPALPVACYAMAAVQLDNSLYVLGGVATTKIGTVQKLNLDSLTWELLPFKLPQARYFFPCFKTETQVYLVTDRTLYSFTPIQVTPVKSVPNYIVGCKKSCYSRGTLYYFNGSALTSLAVGELA